MKNIIFIMYQFFCKNPPNTSTLSRICIRNGKRLVFESILKQFTYESVFFFPSTKSYMNKGSGLNRSKGEKYKSKGSMFVLQV